MRRFLRCVVLCFLALAIQPKFTTATNSNTTKQPIYLVALLPTDATSGAWTAEDSDIACEIAVDDINNAKNLLDGYELRLRKKPTDVGASAPAFAPHSLSRTTLTIHALGAQCTDHITRACTRILDYNEMQKECSVARGLGHKSKRTCILIALSYLSSVLLVWLAMSSFIS